MLPLAQLIQLDPSAPQARYLQIVTQIIQHIQQGRLQPGQRLPGSRQWAKTLQLNRNTIVAAWEELQAQGWLEIRPNRGAFVVQELPVVKAQPLTPLEPIAKEAFQDFRSFPAIDLPPSTTQTQWCLDDGLPDVRLAPLTELGRAYRSLLGRPLGQKLLYYGDPQGSLLLRQQLSEYLQQSRGMQVRSEQMMLTRGCMMSLYLLSQSLLQAGDAVVVGENSYQTANMIFAQAGAQLVRIPVDEKGLVVEQMEGLLQQYPVKAVYVASQHHHPTTVTLSAARRMQLVELAMRYGFRILEDDYDYEFHYPRNPILPMASVVQGDPIVYLGSLSKTLAPAFRIGYLVANEALITALVRLRRVVDRQGDQLLEQVVGELFQEGLIQRHLRKSLAVYRERRDYFCQQLREQLGEQVSFQVPEGGLAVWATFAKEIDLEATVQQATKGGLMLSSGSYYLPRVENPRSTRLGFARSNEKELREAVKVLQQSLSFFNS